MSAFLSLEMVEAAGIEPALANYLLHTGYKSAVLPLNYASQTVNNIIQRLTTKNKFKFLDMK